MQSELSRDICSYDVLGIPISVVTPEFAAEIIEEWSRDDKGRFICVRDVASLMVSIDDPDLVSLHKKAAMVTPDGMPLALIGKFRRLPVQRTSGPDLMDLVCSQSPQTGLKHYFYGGKDGVAEKLAKVFQGKYPGIRIVGYECPPFRPLTLAEDKAVVERIMTSGADVVWVGISSPKQDIWMRDHYQRLPQTLIGVGAAFDFHSGEVKRAPVWMQKAGFEWLHRLGSEPKRLWRRYLILAPRFILLVCVDNFAKRFRRKRIVRRGRGK